MKKIITIARQYGSGGREIGKNLPKLMAYHFMIMKLFHRQQKKPDLQKQHLNAQKKKHPTVCCIRLRWE